MIMRDRQTDTLWQHATGEALAGPLQGMQLELLGGVRTTWGDWRTEHPESEVIVGPEKWPGIVPLAYTRRLLEVATRSGKVPGLTPTDKRLPQNEEIIGLSLAGEARAYPLARLRQTPIINDEVGDVPITLVYQPENGRVRVFRRPSPAQTLAVQNGFLATAGGTIRWDHRGQPVTATAEPLPPLQFERVWWGGWYEFHPDTTIYRR